MTSSQHATLSTTAEQPKPEKKSYMKRWFTPTTIVITIATALNILGMVMILGSMQQIYRQMNTLTDFTGNCILNDYTGKGATTPAEPPPVAAPTPKVALKPALAPTPSVSPKQNSLPINNRLFDINDIVNKK